MMSYRKVQIKKYVHLTNDFPKTEASRSIVEQFQRCWRNWNWHSLMPVAAPSPTWTMWSGCFWHRRRCFLSIPGMWSQYIRGLAAVPSWNLLRNLVVVKKRNTSVVSLCFVFDLFVLAHFYFIFFSTKGLLIGLKYPCLTIRKSGRA